MSVDTTNIKQSFVMNGVTTAFTLTLDILESEPTSIKAVVINATGTRSTLAYTTDYTVTVNAEGNGGVIKVTDAKSASDTLFVYRETSDLQESAYEDYNQFPAATVESDLDRRTMRSQEAKDDLARALKFSVTTTNLTGSTLPTPINGMGLKWSGTDGTLVNTTVPLDSAATLAISAASIAQGAATSASVFAANALASQYAAASEATIAGSYATIAGTYASLAISAANTALGANRTIDTLLITTNAVINIATIGTLNVTTKATIADLEATVANITGLTVGTINITDMDTVTIGSMTVMTTANINTAIIGALSATNATITNLTVGTVTITDMDTVTVGSITVTTKATIALADVTLATIGTLTIATACTANAMDMAVATAGNLLVTTTATINAISAGTIRITTDASIANATITGLTVTTINISAGTIAKEVAISIPITGATTTFTTQADFNKLFGSAGRASGGEITTTGTDTIAVAAGTGFIKATDSDVATLIAFDWVAGAITVLTNTTTYIYVTYNGGVPTIATTTIDGSWDLDTSFPLGSVVQEMGSCHVLNNPWWVTDGMTNLIERSDARAPIFRDNNIGGLILSSTADRRVAVTAGKLWKRLNEYDIPLLATNSTFEVYWRTSSTLWADADVTTLSTIKYNNITTNSLEDISNNKFVNWWCYAEADDKEIAFVYPQAEYISAAAAEAVGAPTALPAHIQQHGILIGRIIMQQGTTAPVETQSAFDTVFAGTAAADHGNLTGLADDDHTQYLLTSGTRSQGTINVATSATIATAVITTASITNLTAGTLTVTGIQAGLAATIGSLLVTTDATIGLLTTGTFRCTTIATINVASIGTLFVNTSGSFALLTCGNLQVKTTATIATGVITTLRSGITSAGTLFVMTRGVIGLCTAGNLVVTTGAVIGLGTIGTFTVTTGATMNSATITALFSGPTTVGSLMVTTLANIALVTVGNLTVTTSASIASLSAPLISSTTSTITNITATTISVGATQIWNKLSKGILIETPGGAEDLTLFKVTSAATITEMYAIVKGTSPSVTWVIKHGTDRSGGGASVLTAGTTTTDTTTGSTVTVFSDATIAANSWVWLVTTATSGTISSLGVSINYTIDA